MECQKKRKKKDNIIDKLYYKNITDKGLHFLNQ